MSDLDSLAHALHEGQLEMTYDQDQLPVGDDFPYCESLVGTEPITRWLADHDLRVREETKAGIAKAIKRSTPDRTGQTWWEGRDKAARIAESWQPEGGQ